MVSAASAGVSFYVDAYDNGLVAGTMTYDLHAVIDGDRYQAHEIATTLDTGTLYSHPFQTAGALPPNAAFIPSFPDLAYDSFLSTPYDYPNPDTAINGASTPGTTEDATGINGGIFVAGNTAIDGDFVLVRLTVSADAVGEAVGRVVTTENLAGYDYVIPIPEPGSLALLALGGLALIRRR